MTSMWRLMRGRVGPVKLLTRQAAAARREGRFRDAAGLYVQALRIDPGRGPLHVQAGHMFKEAGEIEEAERHYLSAAELMPDDADLALQFGHFYKTAGRLTEAHAAYERAAALSPGWEEPRRELANMHRAGWRRDGQPVGLRMPEDPLAGDPARLPYDPRIVAAYGAMAPEQLPRPFRTLVRRSEPSINIAQFGVRLNTYWGHRRVARGVEAIRGFCISAEPLLNVTALVNGLTVHGGPVKGPYELEYEPDRERVHKYVFNIWCDFSPFAPGLYALELRFKDSLGAVRVLHEDFVVEPPLKEEDHPDSDAIVTLIPGDPRPIEEQVNSRPSAVHEAARPNMLPEISRILVMRPDQLGDLVTSVPGLERLRELFPDATIVGLCSPANADLARTLGVFDDVVVSRFDEDIRLRGRIMDWDAQERLRETLAGYRFDIAIDLSSSRMSRPFLMLSGAPFLYGFNDPDWPRLTASVDDAYHDPKNYREIATHSTRVLTMIERLAALHRSGARVIRRDDLPRERLAPFGIGAQDRYAVIHMGARIVFSRWHHYLPLAERLHRDTDLKIVLFADRPGLRDRLSAELAASPRVIVIEGQVPFDDFDALLSWCDVYVGNDSGPKHLASLRGVPVVSIHSARINWSEWGQEHGGVIVTRKVPCAGCLIYHDVDECGKDFVCVTAIGLDDVYAAVRRYV